MKVYVKPTFMSVEIRTAEGIAVAPSCLEYGQCGGGTNIQYQGPGPD